MARAVSPTLLNTTPAALSWAVLDGPTAAADLGLANYLRANGTSLLVDTQSWRFAYGQTLAMTKWATLPFTPQRPYDGSTAWIREYAKVDLEFQSKCEVDAYLLPAWFPQRGEDCAGVLQAVFDAANSIVGHAVDAKPLVATLPVWRTRTDAAYASVAALHHGISAVYAIPTPGIP